MNFPVLAMCFPLRASVFAKVALCVSHNSREAHNWLPHRKFVIKHSKCRCKLQNFKHHRFMELVFFERLCTYSAHANIDNPSVITCPGQIRRPKRLRLSEFREVRQRRQLDPRWQSETGGLWRHPGEWATFQRGNSCVATVCAFGSKTHQQRSIVQSKAFQSSGESIHFKRAINSAMKFSSCGHTVRIRYSLTSRSDNNIVSLSFHIARADILASRYVARYENFERHFFDLLCQHSLTILVEQRRSLQLCKVRLIFELCFGEALSSYGVFDWQWFY